jgi:hypothetical protein
MRLVYLEVQHAWASPCAFCGSRLRLAPLCAHAGVLDSRTGTPILMALVYLEVAARLGVTMRGVLLPVHFMLRPDVEDMRVRACCVRGL